MSQDKPRELLISFDDGSYKKIRPVSWKQSQWGHYRRAGGTTLRVNLRRVLYIDEMPEPSTDKTAPVNRDRLNAELADYRGIVDGFYAFAIPPGCENAALYDRGNALTLTHASQPMPGQYRVDRDRKLFLLGAAPVGPVTMDA